MKKSLLMVSAIIAVAVAAVWLARGVDLAALIKHLHGR
jgi:hypothetical protein